MSTFRWNPQMAMKLPTHCFAARGVSYASPSDGPSKPAARLVLQLRQSPAPVSATLRRSLRHLPHATLLSTLRHLLHQQDWQLALPMYLSLTDSPWFNWNAELHAELVALLTSTNQIMQAESTIKNSEENLDPKQRIRLNKALIQQYARFGLKDEVFVSFKSLQALTPHATGLSLNCLLHAYASMDLPHEALAILRDMQQQGLKTSFKDYKAILFSFGKRGMFSDMEALALEMEKLKLLNDPVSFSMILSTYANAKNHGKVKDWLCRMLTTGLKPSVHSLNAVSKACEVLTEVSNSKTFVKVGALLNHLTSQGAKDGELEVVKAFLEVCLIKEVVTWESNWELDLHNTIIGSAYVMLGCWLQEVANRLQSKQAFPAEIAIVTGWGKHSEIRGTSLTKIMTRDLLEDVKSPFRVDSQNKGRLLAKPLAVLEWFNAL